MSACTTSSERPLSCRYLMSSDERSHASASVQICAMMTSSEVPCLANSMTSSGESAHEVAAQPSTKTAARETAVVILRRARCMVLLPFRARPPKVPLDTEIILEPLLQAVNDA